MNRATLFAFALVVGAGCANSSPPAETGPSAPATPADAPNVVAAPTAASCRMVVAVTGMT